ncbi:MAG: hypothetical protein K0S33_2152 [Bacteroidetes bacterium]|jgi:hypothetical protein|nr:hypothetical protein [Bacteroidota bacterium]
MDTDIAEKPLIKEPERKTERKVQPETESQVIVHGSFKGSYSDFDLIRIWRTTFLIPHESAHRSRLMHCENITLYPNWTMVSPGEEYRFTLIFSGLPKSCKVFDLIEEIPQAGGFEIRDIARNKMDVYRLNFNG